jgi:hypothetical protein
MARGKGKRCYGFISKDFAYAHCSRDEFAGEISMKATSHTYPHLLRGRCDCGRKHTCIDKERDLVGTENPKQVATYNYRGASSELLFQVVRYQPKAFRMRRPDGNGGWIWNLDGVQMVPYRLPELLAANPKRRVYVCEGEQDVRTLENHGFLATTNPGGAGKWRPEYSEALSRRKVTVLCDNDDAGRDHAQRTASSLHVAGAAVKIVTLPGLNEHEDVTDWFTHGRTREQLITIVRDASRYMPTNEGRLLFQTPREVAQSGFEAPRWVVDGLLAEGAVTDVIGKVKVAGKSTFFTHLASAVTRGIPFLRLPTMKSPVVYLTEQNWTSFREALRRAGLLDNEDFAFLSWRNALGHGWTEVAGAAIKECHRRGARLLIVDTIGPFADLAGANENDSGHALAAMKPLQEGAATGIAVGLAQHERKGGGDLVEAGRGSTAFAGAVDILVSLRRRPGNGNPNFRELHTEGRFDETPSSLLIELTDNGYVSHGPVRPIADEEACEAIVEALTKGSQPLTTTDVEEMGVSRTTATKALEKLRKDGALLRSGKGVRGDPHRYSLHLVPPKGNG